MNKRLSRTYYETSYAVTLPTVDATIAARPRSAVTSWLSFVLVLLFVALSVFPQLTFAVANRCNPVSINTCSLPFPSDLFRNNDGTLNYSDDIFDRTTSGGAFLTDGQLRSGDKVYSAFPAGFRASQILNKSKGFSALGPVLFELPEPAQEGVEDADGNNAIDPTGAGQLVVFNWNTGDIVPMVVSLSNAAKPKLDPRPKSDVIIAWPRSRFEFSGEYVAVLLKDGLHTEASGGTDEFSPSGSMQSIINGTGLTWYPNVQAKYDLLFDFLAIVNYDGGVGIAKSNILSLTYFTVRPESEVLVPLPAMVQTALAKTASLENLHQVASLDTSEDALMTLSGDISLVNFRREDGGIYPEANGTYLAQPDSSLDFTDFVLVIPKPNDGEDVPIMVRGHGLANLKDRKHLNYRRAGRLHVAVMAIDQPNHGKRSIRSPLKAPYIITATRTPAGMMQMLGMFVQSVIDHAVVARATHDLLPEKLAKLQLLDPTIPDLNVEKMYYQGMSLGAMMGAPIGLLAPYLEGAYLVNGASSLIHLFSKSAFWDGKISFVIPLNATGAEATFAIAMMQHYVDIADGANFAQWYKTPPAGRFTRKLGMHYSVGDGGVVNAVSLALAEVADLPLMKDVIEPVPLDQLRFGDVGFAGFEDGGYGVMQAPFGLEAAEDIIEQLKKFDPANQVEGADNLGDFEDNLGDFVGLDVFDAIADSGLTDLPGFSSLAALLAAFGINSELDSFSDLIDQVYEGDMEAFLTHFNRGSIESVGHNIDWVCLVVDLAIERCDYAKTMAEEVSNGVAFIPEEPDWFDPAGLLSEINLSRLADAEALAESLAGAGGINVNVSDGGAGSTEPFGLSILALLILWRTRFLTLLVEQLKSPAGRTIISAMLSATVWFWWAVWISWGQAEQTWVSGLAQGFSSFSTTFIGTWMMELMYVRLGSGSGSGAIGYVLNVLVVSGCSLVFMLAVHSLAGTQQLLLTVFPVFSVVVVFCAGYLWGLKRIELQAVVIG